MADSSYVPKVYREQGGNRLVVAPGGELLIEGAVRGLIKGRAFYVDSATGSNSNDGTNWTQAVATIDYAVGLCTANRGDIIFVAPGHTETVSAAGGLDLDVAGISIIGIGNGTLQPKVDLTAELADVDIDAANITIENLQFEASFADIAAAVDVNATDCTIRGCRFLAPTTNENALIWILGATSTTSNRLVVENCWFQDKDAANTSAISYTTGTPDGCVVRNCVFHGFYETGGIYAGGAVTNILIIGNVMQNSDTDADACILLAANSTGIVAYNGVGAALAADATTNISCGAGVVLIQNYSVDTGDRQGVLDPAAT